MRADAMARTLIYLVFSCGFLLGVATTVTQAEGPGLSRVQAYARSVDLESIGRRLFADPSLSASGRMACATCHDPRYAFGPPNARDVQSGGSSMQEPGLRAVPSLAYLQ